MPAQQMMRQVNVTLAQCVDNVAMPVDASVPEIIRHAGSVMQQKHAGLRIEGFPGFQEAGVARNAAQEVVEIKVDIGGLKLGSREVHHD